MASRKKSGPVGLTPVSPRHWFFTASVLLLLMLSLTLMGMQKSGNPTVLRLRTQIMDMSAPVLSTVASPFSAVSEIGVWFSEMTDLRAQNVALKNENLQLLEWQSLAKSMQAENASLKQLLNVVSTQKNHYISARMVSDITGPYVRSALLGAGSEQGIKKDQAVISERGLIGRVIEVGQSSARVLLLSDINSRVPVMLETSREKGILAGDSDGSVKLTYLTADANVPGERIVTSGDGGMFPQGLAVGALTETEKNSLSVQLFADPARAEYVTVIDFAL